MVAWLSTKAVTASSEAGCAIAGAASTARLKPNSNVRICPPPYAPPTQRRRINHAV
jgi:hypothetical protein